MHPSHPQSFEVGLLGVGASKARVTQFHTTRQLGSQEGLKPGLGDGGSGLPNGRNWFCSSVGVARIACTVRIEFVVRMLANANNHYHRPVWCKDACLDRAVI